MANLTRRQQQAEMKALNMVVRFNRETGEWRVNYPGASERYAYYTSDETDAFDTARMMARVDRDSLRPDLRVKGGR